MTAIHSNAHATVKGEVLRGVFNPSLEGPAGHGIPPILRRDGQPAMSKIAHGLDLGCRLYLRSREETPFRGGCTGLDGQKHCIEARHGKAFAFLSSFFPLVHELRSMPLTALFQ